MEKQHKHLPLSSPRSIRILSLEPAVSKTTPLSCSVEEVSLDSFPRYFALSYSWDAQAPSHPIDCGGSTLLITANCAAALRALRHENQQMPMWIDSICIDQSSLDERSQQVTLMGDIYKRAGVVVIWLGESDVRSEAALKRLAEIATWDKIEGEDPQLIANKLTDATNKLDQDVRNRLEDPFGPLFERSWFHRMWTIQEATLAKKAIICFGHNSTILWRTFVLLVEDLEIRRYKWCNWQKAMQLQRYLSKLLAYRRAPPRVNVNIGAERVKRGEGETFPIVSEILMHARLKSSSDPKDKVFALYAVLNELGVPFLQPDYRKSVEDIYTGATIASINYDNNLDILFQVPSITRIPKLPSWVPDWGVPEFSNPYRRHKITREYIASRGLYFRPDKGADSAWQFSTDSKVLTLRGRVVDSVKQRTIPVHEVDCQGWVDSSTTSNRRSLEELIMMKLDSFREVLRDWITLSSQYENYPTGETVQETLERIILAELEAFRKPVEIFIEGQFNFWYEVMTNPSPLPLRDHIIMDGELVEEIVFRSSPQQKLFTRYPFVGSPLSKIHYQIVKLCSRKCFFSTENGFFGTAPDQIRPNDQIAVASGVSMPLVLRPTPEGFQLVSNALVHGIMYGEAWPDDESELVNITLV